MSAFNTPVDPSDPSAPAGATDRAVSSEGSDGHPHADPGARPAGAEASIRPTSGLGTRVVHAGLPSAAQGEPFLPGPTFAAPYHLRGAADASPYGYGRYDNPTWTGLEEAIGALEGGPAAIFPSGMAAVTAVLLTCVPPGGTVVAPSDAYPGVRAVAGDVLEPHGVEVRFVPTDERAVLDALDGAALCWIETPSNPALDVLDVAAIARAAHAAGALLAVDNTLATPLAQQPLALGADVSMSSGSKALSGHSDLILGHLACADPALLERLRAWRATTGAVVGPFEAWLAHRSIATMDLRHRRQCANAQALAELLDGRAGVAGVRYPGLPGHPGHALAARQMGGRFGSVLGFELPDAERAQAFLDASALVAQATSFGGVHTSAELRARWGTDAVSQGFIRFSAGIEERDDLLADVSAALDAVR